MTDLSGDAQVGVSFGGKPLREILHDVSLYISRAFQEAGPGMQLQREFGGEYQAIGVKGNLRIQVEIDGLPLKE